MSDKSITFSVDLEVELTQWKLGLEIFDLAVVCREDTSIRFESCDQINFSEKRLLTFEEYAPIMIKQLSTYCQNTPHDKIYFLAHNGFAHDYVIILDNLERSGHLDIFTEFFKDAFFLDSLSFFQAYKSVHKGQFISNNQQVSLALTNLCDHFLKLKYHAHTAMSDAESLIKLMDFKPHGAGGASFLTLNEHRDYSDHCKTFSEVYKIFLKKKKIEKIRHVPGYGSQYKQMEIALSEESVHPECIHSLLDKGINWFSLVELGVKFSRKEIDQKLKEIIWSDNQRGKIVNGCIKIGNKKKQIQSDQNEIEIEIEFENQKIEKNQNQKEEKSENQENQEFKEEEDEESENQKIQQNLNKQVKIEYQKNKAELKIEKLKQKEENLKEKEKLKADRQKEKEKQKEENRKEKLIEKERQKEENQNEKERLRTEKLIEKERQKEENQKEKERQKAERQKEKERQKLENQKEKERLKEERQKEKERQKLENQKEKEKQKEENRKEKQIQKERQKEENQKEKERLRTEKLIEKEGQKEENQKEKEKQKVERQKEKVLQKEENRKEKQRQKVEKIKDKPAKNQEKQKPIKDKKDDDKIEIEEEEDKEE